MRFRLAALSGMNMALSCRLPVLTAPETQRRHRGFRREGVAVAVESLQRLDVLHARG